MYSVSAPQQGRRHRVFRSFAFILTTTATGSAAGATLGLVGGALARDVRLALLKLLAVGAFGLGWLDLAQHGVRVLQFDRETPPPWTSAGALRWAIRNGYLLGLGALSRLGFWLWFVVPIGSLLAGEAIGGACLYGTYGLVQGGAVCLLMVGRRWGIGGSLGIHVWLVSQMGRARTLAALLLITDGTAVVTAFNT